LNKDGEWVTCTPTFREYEGEVYLIGSYGGPEFEVTKDHQIWVGRESKWGWIEAKDVREGDMLLQPWDNFSCEFLPGRKRPYICFDERITSSKETKKVALSLTDEVAELLGFWFGDGHLEHSSGAICFTQHEDETENIDRISELVYSIFGKHIATYPHGEHAIRVKFYSKALMNWLLENGYKNDQKSIPWKVSDLNDSILMHFLRGLIYTDGDISVEDKHIGFTSTSGNLAQFVYFGLQRLGCSPTIHVSKPRRGSTLVKDHFINGQRECYGIRSSGYHSMGFINWLLIPYTMNRKTYSYGQAITLVSDITKREYKGKVYDVSVQGDEHSFCLPGVAIHNCGAGMVNTALVYQTMVGKAFSIVGSGDYIDNSSAKAVNSTATRMMSIKEKGVNLLDPTEGDPKQLREREAIVVYYRNLIHNIIDGIKKEFKKDNSSIELPEEIPWIIGGGTSKAKNFIEFFKKEFDKEKENFPIAVSIRAANDPLGDVAKGLLIAAMND
jgi:intein/homing endonuclease